MTPMEILRSMRSAVCKSCIIFLTCLHKSSAGAIIPITMRIWQTVQRSAMSIRTVSGICVSFFVYSYNEEDGASFGGGYLVSEEEAYSVFGSQRFTCLLNGILRKS